VRRDLDRPLSDDHWTPLRDDDRLREVLGIIDVKRQGSPAGGSDGIGLL
jgi:hypothetical protein